MSANKEYPNILSFVFLTEILYSLLISFSCLLLASTRSSKSYVGKSTEQEAQVMEFPTASCHFLLYVPLVPSDLTAHTHSNLNSSIRLTDKLSPPCTMSTKLLRVLLSPVYGRR